MGNIQRLVPKRGVNIHNEFWPIDHSTVELPNVKKFLTTNPWMLAIYIVTISLLIFEWGI